MNLLDVQIKIMLNNAKSKPDPIKKLHETSIEIYNELKESSPERQRYWINFIRRIHPLLDNYIDNTVPVMSDVIADHILNTQADTQSVDLTHYFRSDSEYQPYPVRLTLRHKIPTDQLKMIEDGYFNLNINYANIMGVLFDSLDTETWSILRYAAHDYYNTQDFLGYQIKIKLKDQLLTTFRDKFKTKLNLLNQYIPLQESIVIDNESITLKVEDKDMVVDIFGNKIINMPTTVSNTALQPVMVE